MHNRVPPASLAGGGRGEGTAQRSRDPLPPAPSHRGRGALAVGAALILAGGALHAQTAPGWKPMTAKQLASACHSADPAQHATCVGYVSGIYDLQFSPTPPRGVCPPDNFSPDLLTEVVTAYLDTHEDGFAPAAIGQAIVRFFPCSEPRK
jgi:Rap1a immunity proteins